MQMPATFIQEGLHVAARLSYAVQVDLKSGEVFWWKPLESHANKRLQAATIELLEMIRFLPSSSNGFLSGKIEIVFNRDAAIGNGWQA